MGRVFTDSRFIEKRSFLKGGILGCDRIYRGCSSFGVILTFTARLPSILREVGTVGTRRPIFTPSVPITNGKLFAKGCFSRRETRFRAICSGLTSSRDHEICRGILGFGVDNGISCLCGYGRCSGNGVCASVLQLNNGRAVVSYNTCSNSAVDRFATDANKGCGRVCTLRPSNGGFGGLYHGASNVRNVALCGTKT